MKSLLAGVMPALAAVLLLSAGCKSISTSHNQEVGGPRFAPTNPSKVEIITTRPTRPFVRVGEVRVESSDPRADASKIENALRKEAAKLGADAAVVVYDKVDAPRTKYIEGWRSRGSQPAAVRVTVAVAIKYQS